MTLSKKLWLKSKKAALFSLYSPFVVSLISGTLEVEVFRHYIAQDSHFLQAFAQAYELAADWAVDEEVKRVLGELREAVMEELKMHDSTVEEWGVDVTKEATPNPATLQYTGFLLATAKGIIKGCSFPDSSIDSFQRTKITAYIVGSMIPCMRLYSFLGKELQMLLELGESSHPYRTWIDTYSSASFEASALQIEELLDKLSIHLSGDDLEVVEKLHSHAMDLEFEFFYAQPIVQSIAVPVTRFADRLGQRLFILTDFDLTCTDIDSCAVLSEAAISTATTNDQNLDKPNTMTAQQCKKSWDDLVMEYLQNYEQCLTNILSAKGGKEEVFSYEVLHEALQQLSEFEKLGNSRVVDSRLLKGIHIDDIKESGRKVKFKSGCLDFLRDVLNKKDQNIDLQVLSLCWSGDLIRSAFSSGGLDNLSILSNDLDYESSFTTGDIIRRLETPVDKSQAFRKIISTQDGSRCLYVYIGDSPGDLLCMLEADVGIVIGSSGSLRRVGQHFGVTFKPLLEGLVDKQRRLSRGGSPLWRGLSGTLYTVSCWEEIHAFITGP